MKYDITRSVDGDEWAIHITPQDIYRLAVDVSVAAQQGNRSALADLLTFTIPGDTRITLDEAPGWRTTAPLFSHHDPEHEAAEPWGCDDCDNYAQNGARHCQACEEVRATADAYERDSDYRQDVQ